MTTNYLLNPIILPSDAIVKLKVVPMPKPDADGRYKPRRDYSVNMGLSYGGKLVGPRSIGTVICGEPEVEFADSSKLSEAGIEALDSEGWDQLLGLGVVPTKLVLQTPH